MNIALCRHGLANQIIHYIYGRYLELLLNEPVYLETTDFSLNYYHNGFELDNIFPNIKLKLLKDLYDDDSWIKVLYQLKSKTSIIKSFNQLELNKVIFVADIMHREWVGNNTIYVFDGNDSSSLKRLSYIEHKYHRSYYYDNRYFLKIKDKMLHELTFQDIPAEDTINLEYMEKIKQTNSVALHVRRGDFAQVNRILPAEIYAKAVNKLRDEKENLTYYIFSDDLPWCEENIVELGFLPLDDIVLVKGNDVNSKNYIDMQLMAQCKYIISNARSTFSRVAGWLNPNLIEHITVYF